MPYLKFLFIFAFIVALSGVKATPRDKRETTEEAAAPQEPNQLDQIQQHLSSYFENVKKTMDDLASKFNSEDIVKGIQNISTQLEGYVKQAADQLASSASGTATTEQKKEEEAPASS